MANTSSTDTQTSSISIKNVSKSYRGKRGQISVIEDLSLELDSGRIHAILGPSGCGKSTLLMLTGALLQPDSGAITLDGVNLMELNRSKRAVEQSSLVGFVFQKFHLIPYLSVEENIKLSCLARSVGDADDRCAKLIEKLGLNHRYGHLPSELSSGEQQRVALGRALMNDPKVLIADEPTGNLDRHNADHLMTLLREFSNDGGTVLMATHDHQVADMADQQLPFAKGKFSTTMEKDGE
jgi:ABC-type lipoprotein export system ATPase subunit